MAGPIAIDTPDYQRGVVSAQKLLGSFPGSQLFATVGIPPNAESLVIITAEPVGVVAPNVVGATTGSVYAGVSLPSPPGSVGTFTGVFDISSAADSSVTIEWNGSPGSAWWAYADAAAHVVADLSKLVNRAGEQYVIAAAPSTAAGDHPPNELTYHSAVFSAAGVMLPALLAGQRYRVFAAQLMLEAGTLVGYLGDSLSGEVFLIGGAGSPGQLSYPLTGLPLPATASINFFVATGAGTVAGMVVYTIENV